MRFAFDPCPEPQAFVFAHGARARSLDEFRRVLAEAPAEVAWYHRLHVGLWLRDVLDAPTLAERVEALGRAAKGGEALRRALEDLLDDVLLEAARPPSERVRPDKVPGEEAPMPEANPRQRPKRRAS